MIIQSICIVGLDDYPILTQQSGHVNGESVQHVLLARAWRDLGVKVSLVVYGSRDPMENDVEGIRVIQAYRPRAGVPMLRFVHPMTTRLYAALGRADADVYYQSPSGMQTGVTAWFCQQRRKSFVYRVASDVNCIPGRQLIRYWRDRKLYEYGLMHADFVAVQTQYQRALLRQNYGRESQIVNMAVEVPERAGAAVKDIDVLWVSNLRSVKRPEMALQLAQSMPDVRFAFAGGSLAGAEQYYESVREAARACPNVSWLGAVAYRDVGALFDRAKVLLNTSEVEGFPNTFLQAWIRAVPVVTFFDPDKLVSQKHLGRAVSDIDEMRTALRALLDDATTQRAIGERARSFAMAEYSAPAVARKYLEWLGEPAVALRDGTTG